MTKEIILNTKRELADYYRNQEFAETDFEILKKQDKHGEIEVCSLSDEYYLKEFLSEFGSKDYRDIIKNLDSLDIEGNEDIKKEFEIYRDEDENYPVQYTVYRIKNNSNCVIEYYENEVDRLKEETGLGLLEFKGEYYLFICGGGYCFTNAHWIPLFTKFFKWIDEDCGEKLKTIEIQNKKHAVYSGSDELKELITNTLHRDRDFYKFNEYNEYHLTSLKDTEKLCKNDEFNLLIRELENNNFEHLIIE